MNIISIDLRDSWRRVMVVSGGGSRGRQDSCQDGEALGAFTPQYFSHKGSWELSSWELFSSHELSSDRVHTGISSWGRIRKMKPLTSLLLLLLWVYWEAANNFTAYTATRSPRPEVPGVGGFYWSLPSKSPERRHLLISTAPMFSFVLP